MEVRIEMTNAVEVTDWNWLVDAIAASHSCKIEKFSV